MTSQATKTVAALALILGTFAATGFATTTGAEAALQTRPAVTAAGAPSPNRAQAQATARSKWSQQARIRYGNQFANWNSARGRSMNCKKTLVIWTCRATANPAANIVVCRGSVTAKSDLKPSRASAQQAAIRKWSKRASRAYGASFANWGMAGARNLQCGTGPRGRGFECRATAQACS